MATITRISLMSLLLLTACTSRSFQPDLDATATLSPPTRTAPPSASPSPTATSTSTLTASPTVTPTETRTPTPTATPIGGGNGALLLEPCWQLGDCPRFVFSITDRQVRGLEQPYLMQEVVNPDTYKNRLVLHDPVSGSNHTILECSDEYESCSQSILTGSLQDAPLYLTQNYQRKLYDGQQTVDLYRLDTSSLENTLVDQFEGVSLAFILASQGTGGLLAIDGNTFQGELALYDLATQERRTILLRMGSFFRLGITPDPSVFWYRIADYCETELVAADSSRVSHLPNSDGILGWLDEETFLLFAAGNNPPFCTRTGIALANRYGLTGQWVTTSRADWAALSPDGNKVFFTGNCNSRGCTQLSVVNSDGSEARLLLEAPERFTSYEDAGHFSPDGRLLAFNAGKQVWLVDAGGRDPQLVYESETDWRRVHWMEE